MNQQPSLIQKAIQRLEGLLLDVDKWIKEGLDRNSSEWTRWQQEVKGILTEVYGQTRAQKLEEFRGATGFSISFSIHYTSDAARKEELARNQESFKKMLPHAKAFIEAEVNNLKMRSPEEPLESKEAGSAAPRIFIAHGGQTTALDKLKSFLEALGVKPLVVEEQPSQDRSVNEQVEHNLGQADCAIILGTADDKNLKDGKLYPRPNVCIEIGRFQERFPGRIVYLLEKGASFPSNIGEKVRGPFTQENMEGAFIKVANELRAFGILKAVAPNKEANSGKS